MSCRAHPRSGKRRLRRFTRPTHSGAPSLGGGGCEPLGVALPYAPTAPISMSASVDWWSWIDLLAVYHRPPSPMVEMRAGSTLARVAQVDHERCHRPGGRIHNRRSMIGCSCPPEVRTNMLRRSLQCRCSCVSISEDSVSMRATITVTLSAPPASFAMSTSRFAASRGVVPASV